jgi:hypothetical protein
MIVLERNEVIFLKKTLQKEKTTGRVHVFPSLWEIVNSRDEFVILTSDLNKPI